MAHPLGEHADDFRAEFGYSAAEIAALGSEGMPA
jgi:hypothetical protein